MRALDSRPEQTGADGEKIGPLAKALYLLATIQIAWYYLRYVPSYMYLYRYENGADRMPFQGRVMMMFALRWAHSSTVCIALASGLKRFAPWVLRRITPESVLLMCIYTGCIVVTGIVIMRIYRAASRERLLTVWIYPIVLILCVAAYILHATQNLGYYYDFPSLMFFSVGLYLIYFRRHPALFAGWFLLGTINRETTLMLLLFFVLARTVENGRVDWRRLKDLRTWAIVLPLALTWLAWHQWVDWVFRANPTELSYRFLINTGLVLFPLCWPQLFSAGCYMFPAIFLLRRSVRDATLRVWLWTLPAWFGLMFAYGIFIETRIFGELTAYLACLTALIAEESVVETLKKRGWSDVRSSQRPAAPKLALAVQCEARHEFSDSEAFREAMQSVPKL
ncbi:MAG: hypothetical protein WA708_12090 [Acidobacteriaceae bacterium]